MQAIIEQPEVEFIAGRPYQKVSPKLAHGLTQAACLRVLYACARGRGAVSTETRFRLAADTMLVPDVSFVAYERLRGLAEKHIQEPPFAPDIAIEVRSRSDRSALIAEKTALYLRYGAIAVLNVDPHRREITAHSARGVMRFTSSQQFCADAVDWLRFDISEVFADLDFPR